jgi:hypothetical protein
MLSLAKIVHVLAVGLWFGMGVFFTFVVGLSLFDTFENLTSKPREERPLWLPVPAELDRESPGGRFPDPLRKEQGSRIAGAAVGPMFPWYYALQAGCGVVGLLTALGFAGRGGVHRVRVLVLLAATAGAGAGWWLERKVEALRVDRSAKSDVVLRSSSPTSEEIEAANAIRATFGQWHSYSLFANFATVALVTVAMALTASLPSGSKE